MMTQFIFPDPGCQQSKFQDPDQRVWVLRHFPQFLLMPKEQTTTQNDETVHQSQSAFSAKHVERPRPKSIGPASSLQYLLKIEDGKEQTTKQNDDTVDELDQIHWKMFDYNQREEVGNFLPNTDLTSGEMETVVLEESSSISKDKER